LFVTGAFNAWLLVGSVAALVGTLYGQLLLAKIALFVVMIALAAFNRLRLLPRLSVTDHGRKATESRKALARIQGNALIEALIGIAIIVIVAALGVQVPGAHQEPWWPFPYRFGLDVVQAVPVLRNDAIGTAIIALIGLLVLGFGLRRRRVLPIGLGLLLFLGLGWRPIQLLMIPATPMSYAVSPAPFAVPSILAGSKAYAQACVFCHGADGQGDGPLAAELPIAPADLTAHLFAHTEGDLFWFISNGMDDGVMPPFAATLDAAQRWDLINLLKARAASVGTGRLSAEVTADPAPLAPDFAFPASAGTPGTLNALLTQDAVLLVMTDEPQSPLIAHLQDWRSVLAENGVTILVLTNDRDVRSVYGFYDRSYAAGAVSDPRPVEFLIDRDGYIRARWRPGDTPDWQDLETLTREITAMSRMKLAPVASLAHVHPSN
jgi:putative copper resistance protein D